MRLRSHKIWIYALCTSLLTALLCSSLSCVTARHVLRLLSHVVLPNSKKANPENLCICFYFPYCKQYHMMDKDTYPVPCWLGLNSSNWPGSFVTSGKSLMLYNSILSPGKPG